MDIGQKRIFQWDLFPLNINLKEKKKKNANKQKQNYGINFRNFNGNVSSWSIDNVSRCKRT
jgi:hypothetical protein